jgi:hypothetical protein
MLQERMDTIEASQRTQQPVAVLPEPHAPAAADAAAVRVEQALAMLSARTDAIFRRLESVDVGGDANGVERVESVRSTRAATPIAEPAESE